MFYSLGLIVLEGQRALGVRVLLARLSCPFDSAIRDDHASPSTAVPHNSQRKLSHAFHQLDVSFREAEHSAVIDHHRRQTRRHQHGRLGGVT